MFPTILRIALVSILVRNCVAELPHFIKTCATDDPNINECIVKRANGAIPYILKYGHKHFNMPALLPFVIDQVIVRSRDDFLLEINKLNIIGFENMKATSAKLDWATNKLEITIKYPRITWLADYKMEGILFDQPINGNGKTNITYVDSFATFIANIKTIEIDGKTYYETYNPNTEYEITDTIYQFEDLYDGDENKSNAMHELINGDWNVLFNEMRTEMTKIIISFYEMGFNSVFKYATADEIFVNNKANTIKAEL